MGNVGDVRRCLTAGCDPNHVYGQEGLPLFFDGQTPLMAAAGFPGSNATVVELLLSAGANLEGQSREGVTAVWYASGGIYPKSILATSDPFVPGGDLERLRVLLEHGACASTMSHSKISALACACRVADPERVRLLLNHGASPWPVEKPKFSSTEFYEDFAAELLEAFGGPDCDTEESAPDYESVPLFEAVTSDCVECVQLILAAGFPPDFRSGCDNALHHARSCAMVDALVDGGTPPKCGDWGRDPADHLAELELYDVMDRFWDRCLKPEERTGYFTSKLLHYAGTDISPRMVRVLLDHGAEISVRSKRGTGILHITCWRGDRGDDWNQPMADVLEMLIEAGADVNWKDSDGGTALHEAAYGDWGSPTAIAVLLRHGAEPDATTTHGVTPLMLAADRGEIDCIKLLLNAGADPKRKDLEGKSAIDYAMRFRSSWKSISSRPPKSDFEDRPWHEFDPEAEHLRHLEVYEQAKASVLLLQEFKKLQE